ncbi:TerB family tellurite resistance protein, partial [Myxococcota bacterium]|nr:TerB family tellurite resistance protein [Myxococcota bacterium]
EINGIHIQAANPDDYPQDGLAFLLAYDPDSMKPLLARGVYRDDDGHFTAAGPLYQNKASFFIPRGAVVAPLSSKVLFMLAIPNSEPGRDDLFPHKPWVVKWQRSDELHIVPVIRPFIRLAMRVAQADGVLDSSEVRYLKNYFVDKFELQKSDLSELKEAMKSEAPLNIREALEDLFRFLPLITPQELFEVLAAVAHADSAIHSKEIGVIKEIFDVLGYHKNYWTELRRKFKLFAGPKKSEARSEARSEAKPKRAQSSRHSALKTLGLDAKATAREIKLAYRKMATKYHPDRVASLGAEALELATQKMTEINLAYDALAL